MINIYNVQHCLLLYLGAAEDMIFSLHILGLKERKNIFSTPKIIKLMFRLVQLSTLEQQDNFGLKIKNANVVASYIQE